VMTSQFRDLSWNLPATAPPPRPQGRASLYQSSAWFSQAGMVVFLIDERAGC
jgi:hypothetical protein